MPVRPEPFRVELLQASHSESKLLALDTKIRLQDIGVASAKKTFRRLIPVANVANIPKKLEYLFQPSLRKAINDPKRRKFQVHPSSAGFWPYLQLIDQTEEDC